MKKKRLIFTLLAILIIVLILVFLVLGKMMATTGVVDEITERSSGDYKITEDIVLINIPQDGFLEDNNLENNVMDNNQQNLVITSSAFVNQESIPVKYTCDGDDVNPSFDISGVVPEAKSLVLIMDDPDAPAGVWDHWIKFNISPTTLKIEEGVEPEGVSGEGTGGNLGYSGPCPPDAEHLYIFKLYSLGIELTLPEGSSRVDVEEAMMGHILQTAELVGKYERIKK